MQNERLSSLTRDPNTPQNTGTGTVRRLRLFIPIIAIILTIITVTWTFMSSEEIASKITEEAIKQISKNELLNPRFDSMDNRNQPFTITAAKAVRGETDDKLVLLTQPAGDITLKNGRWLSIKAESGAYNQDKNRLLLNESVQIFDDQGYTLTTAEMNININEDTILSETPIEAQGPAGTIQSSGLYANMNTGLLSFKGPVTLTLQTAKTGNGPNTGLGGLR